jgi:hypothetical protein
VRNPKRSGWRRTRLGAYARRPGTPAGAGAGPKRKVVADLPGLLNRVVSGLLASNRDVRARPPLGFLGLPQIKHGGLGLSDLRQAPPPRDPAFEVEVHAVAVSTCVGRQDQESYEDHGVDDARADVRGARGVGTDCLRRRRSRSSGATRVRLRGGLMARVHAWRRSRVRRARLTHGGPSCYWGAGFQVTPHATRPPFIRPEGDDRIAGGVK